MKSEFEAQPLDGILKSLLLKNDDLVKASTEQLTHKQVQKARAGRRVTPNIQGKILNALNKLCDEKSYTKTDLFNY